GSRLPRQGSVRAARPYQASSDRTSAAGLAGRPGALACFRDGVGIVGVNALLALDLDPGLANRRQAADRLRDVASDVLDEGRPRIGPVRDPFFVGALQHGKELAAPGGLDGLE